MKIVISIVLMMLGGFAACLFFPWWSISIVSVLVSICIPQKRGVSFLIGFIAFFLLWLGWSFLISVNNHHILAHRVSLLILKMDQPILLCLVTGLVGGVIGGMASLTGSFFRQHPK